MTSFCRDARRRIYTRYKIWCRVTVRQREGKPDYGPRARRPVGACPHICRMIRSTSDTPAAGDSTINRAPAAIAAPSRATDAHSSHRPHRTRRDAVQSLLLHLPCSGTAYTQHRGCRPQHWFLCERSRVHIHSCPGHSHPRNKVPGSGDTCCDRLCGDPSSWHRVCSGGGAVSELPPNSSSLSCQPSPVVAPSGLPSRGICTHALPSAARKSSSPSPLHPLPRCAAASLLAGWDPDLIPFCHDGGCSGCGGDDETRWGAWHDDYFHLRRLLWRSLMTSESHPSPQASSGSATLQSMYQFLFPLSIIKK